MSYFFIPLGFRYGDYWHLGSVYGPYEDLDQVNDELRTNWPNDKKEEFLIFEGQLSKVPPNPKEKPEAEKRKAGDTNNYRVDSEGKYWCRTCDGPVMTVSIAHPIHDGPFPGSGSGQVDYSYEPYCPNCEHKPSPYGAPIRP